MDDNIIINTVFENETYVIVKIEDEDGDIGYNVDFFGAVTLHFTGEEWDEFVGVIESLKDNP